MISGTSHGNYLLRTDRVPGEEPLPYVKFKRKSAITGVVLAFHAAMIVIPLIYMAISEMIKPPVYVMRLPTVDSVPNENPEMSPHPSPLNKKSQGTPDKGKPLSDIPQVPDLVKSVDPPKPKAKPQPKPKPQPKVQPKPKTKPQPKPKTQPKPQPKPKKQPKVKPVEKQPVPESKKTAPAAEPEVKPKPQAKPEKKLLSASDIKISTKRVKNPHSSASSPTASANSQTRAAEQARNNRLNELAQTLRSMSGTPGGTGIPGGGGGPKGIVSKEVNDYYYKVEAYLKRRWEQPSVYGNSHLKVIILFSVAADGRIISARILERSGNAAMDASVENLLKSLKTLPAPPQAMEFTSTMEIDR